MDIHKSAVISLKARLDRTNPQGIHIGADTYVTLGCCILAHDMSRRLRADTRIGRNCFIGAGAIVLPGVTVHDGSIVAAGAVVTKDVPPASIVAGNPARVIRSGIRVGRFGILELADDVSPPASVGAASESGRGDGISAASDPDLSSAIGSQADEPR